MILQAKARPVRIRIKSGGEEHSSFDSLIRHFSVKDLLPSAKDGRLSRWLKQQQKETVAERVESLQESLLSIKEKEETPEQIYIQFVLAFFNLDGDITSKHELLDKWSNSAFSECLECQLLNSSIQQEIAERKKKEYINAMQSSYTQARLGYESNRDLCTSDEWIEIFQVFKKSLSKDADYNWFMYSLTRMDAYLEEAAKLGHENAREILKPNRFGENVRLGLFYGVLIDISSDDYDLVSKKKRTQVINNIANLSSKLKTKEEKTLIDDILRLLNACDKYMCQGEFSELLENVHILKDEALFLQGVYCLGRGVYTTAFDLLQKSKYPLAPLFREFLTLQGSGTIIAYDSVGELDRKQVKATDFTSSSNLRSVGMITRFVITHLLENTCYEK